MNDPDTDTFTQKDLMQHLLHAAQHSVTREEMAAQFSQFEGRNQERFKLIDKRFDDLQREIKENNIELKQEIKEQGRRHDRLSWAIFAGMSAIFFKEYIVKALGI